MDINATESFVTITANFIGQLAASFSCALNKRNVKHTVANVADFFEKIAAKEWQLSMKDVVFVMDNTPNMIATAQLG